MNYQLSNHLAVAISEAVEAFIEERHPQTASKEFLFELGEQWLKARGKMFLIDCDRFAARNPGYDGYALAVPGTIIASNLCDDRIDTAVFRVSSELRNEVETSVVAYRLAHPEERASPKLIELLVLGRMVASGKVRFKNDRDGAAAFYRVNSSGDR